MRSFLVFLLLLGPLFNAHAQVHVFKPRPQWQVGDKRQIRTTAEIRMTLMDSIHLKMSSSSAYTLQITDQRKDHYVLSMRLDADSDPFGSLKMEGDLPGIATDSAMRMVTEFIKAIGAPLAGFETRYRISTDGVAQEVLDSTANIQRLRSAIEIGLTSVMKTISEHAKEPVPPLSQEKLNTALDSLSSKILETELNEMNYILRVYSLEFPLTGSVRTPVLIHDVQAPMHPELTDVPAMQELGLDANTPQEAVCHTVIVYDQQGLMEAFGKAGKDATAWKDVRMTTEYVEHVDKRTGWLTSSSEATDLHTALLSLHVVTTSVLRPIP